MTSSHHALMSWATHVLQWDGQREAEGAERTPQTIPSSDCRLQPSAWSESLVPQHQHTAVNTSGLTPPVTPRKSFTPEAMRANREAATQGGAMTAKS